MQLSRGYAVTCIIVATYSIVQYKFKFKSHSTYRQTYLSWESERFVIQRLLVRAHYASLFFFQQSSLVGIHLNRLKYSIKMTEA